MALPALQNGKIADTLKAQPPGLPMQAKMTSTRHRTDLQHRAASTGTELAV
jgi:hypothetical protein